MNLPFTRGNFFLKHLLLSVLMLLSVVNSQETIKTTRNKTKISIGAMIPLLYTQDLYTFHAAMKTAVRLINSDDGILKDYELDVHYYDSRTVPGNSYHEFYKMIENPPIKQLLIGPNFPDATMAIAEMTTLYSIPQITYLTLNRGTSQFKETNQAESSEDEHRKYPLLVKVAPSQTSFNEANVKLFQHFKWKRVAILYDYSLETYFATAYALSIQLRKAGIEPVVVKGFYEDSSTIDLQFQSILDQDIRVIFGAFGTHGARRIFCEAHNWGMYGRKYQWVVVSTLRDDWWSDKHSKPQTAKIHNCTREQHLKASEWSMRTAQTPVRMDNVTTESGLKPQKIWELVSQQKRDDYYAYVKKTPPHIKTSPLVITEISLFAFDAVYLAAKTLDAAIKEKGTDALLTNYNETEKAKYFVQTAFKMNFEGVTGTMLYGGAYGDERLYDISIKQFHTNSSFSNGEYVRIGYYSIKNKNIDFDSSDGSVYFQGRKIIKDRKTIVRIPRYYSMTMISVLWGLVAVGLLFSLAVLFINIRYRQIRMIKMSSPNINNGIIAGSIICYASVIIYGLDARFLSKHGIQIACNVVTISLSVGFTLSFGCLFSKTWRIYKIFTAAKTMEKVSIKDSHLYAIVVLILGIDVLVFLLWVGISPFSVEEVELEQQLYASEDLVKSYFTYKCSCKYQLHFTVATYCYKGFLLIFGLFLAWETRNVKVAVLNDSKYIGMAVYNVCVVSAVGVICASALYNTAHYSTGYLVVTISIFLCTTGILLLIFVPKIYLLFGKTFDVTYGNISVRTFSSGGPRKAAVSHQMSTSTSEVHSESSIQSGFPLSRSISDIYSSNRCR